MLHSLTLDAGGADVRGARIHALVSLLGPLGGGLGPAVLLPVIPADWAVTTMVRQNDVLHPIIAGSRAVRAFWHFPVTTVRAMLSAYEC